MVFGDTPASVLAFVNAGNSDTMGGGFGVFGAGSNVEWTVTYDEFLFIHSGQFQLKIEGASRRFILAVPIATAVTRTASTRNKLTCSHGFAMRGLAVPTQYAATHC